MGKSKKKPTVKKKTIAKRPVAKKAVKKTGAAKKKVATKKAAKKSVPKKKMTKVAPKVTAKVKKAAAIARPENIKPAKAINLSSFVTPLDDRVLVQLSAAERMTAGGLYIPNTVSDVSGNLQGLVVSVGRGRRDKKGRIHPMDLKVGDKVVFAQYVGSKIKIQGQDLTILRESDVLGVIG